MSAMQIFHSQIQSKDENQQPYLQALAQLAQADLNQMKALEGAPSWDDWFVSET